jgi:hypothetical protein
MSLPLGTYSNSKVAPVEGDMEVELRPHCPCFSFTPGKKPAALSASWHLHPPYQNREESSSKSPTVSLKRPRDKRFTSVLLVARRETD